MILYFVLFGLVILASLILAYQSMKDYQEIPEAQTYGLFLIRKTSSLPGVLNSLLKSSGQIISFERLIKGDKSALVVYGPQSILKFKDNLDLLELEDYTKADSSQISAWEMGVRDKRKDAKIFQHMPFLNPAEQFWWQILLSPQKDSYLSQIRAVLVSNDLQRKRVLADSLQKLNPHLIKLPKAFSDQELLDFYKKRAFRKDPANIILKPAEVLRFVSL